ncbi:hypothetical protein CKO42_18265 [Lamprobacter modestohalophilus]|uniref:Ankyrin repeat domain-containing protein n=1 Tax=Lamprobacter modestohalophilus TaxID=1064514 RepID=A0A9X0WB78_9GAMM|nr:ankyrin repeat domain-containing protein [Lamprobacter modestohalophilus]MBK1620348.1 hypothetical protein [Lamprobacter modestohalophilus]
MDDHNLQLFAAIESEDVAQVKTLLARGANPSAIDEYGESALIKVCVSWNEPESRFLMVADLLDAGADPTYTEPQGSGVLFACVIAKDARLIDYLLSRGADPNKEHDLGEPLYSWAEFDYRYDEYDLNLPEEPTEQDRASEETWLEFLSRLAVKYGKHPPDYLITLRRAGALTHRDKHSATHEP